MAGRRVYGGSDMPALLHNEGITPHAALEALLASSSAFASPHARFDASGSGSILNFEGAGAIAMNQQFYLPLVAEEAGDDADDVDACLRQPEKKRRLTADKVQSLEKSFELDTKLEPGRKIRLAKDLDLQPRQVAIWFQNRRARWKTKQLEKDYEALKSNYSALKMDYENLQKEKEKLKAEVIFLADKVHVKEKEEGGAIEASQWKNSESISSGIEAKDSKTQMMMGVKQEDLSSTNNSSTIFDSESPPPPPPPPHCIDGGRNRFSSEAAASSSGEDEEVKGYHQWLKLEDNSHNFSFPVEDQALWFWPNYV